MKLERNKEFEDDGESDDQALVLGVHGVSTPQKPFQHSNSRLDSISEHS